MRALTLHPDRLLPADPAVRGLARRLYDGVASLPLLSPHGHLDATAFLADAPITDPGVALVGADHYVVRLLHGLEVPLDELLAPPGGAAPSGRALFGHLARHWSALAGTPSRLWLEHVLVEVLGIGTRPSAANADELYDACVARLTAQPLRPRGLVRRFALAVLTTTDGALADLEAHRRVAAEADLGAALLPTLRPDDVADPGAACFSANVARLGEITGCDTEGWPGYLDALRARRVAFAAAGATATDHGVPVTTTERLSPERAGALYRRCVAGEATSAEIVALRGHVLDELAAMAADDGLVMQLHVGVRRDYVRAVRERYGADVGQDFPVASAYTDTLRPLLERYGAAENFRLVLYSLDETTFSREIGPLVSYFPGLFAGAPWWFLDAPDAMGRAFAALGETAGFAKLAGFVDDSRALLSLGARHDVARRVACAYLARLVAEHRMDTDEAEAFARGYAYDRPAAVFRLEGAIARRGR